MKLMTNIKLSLSLDC